MVFIAIADLSHCVRLWRKLSTNCGRKPNTAGMRTSCLPRRLSEGKRPLWGQTINARFVKPAAVALGLVSESERFGWHRFRHSLSTWANETTKDITVSQTMLRHAKPDTTAIYTHGNFGKALDAQRVYMEQLLRMKPASESTQ